MDVKSPAGEGSEGNEELVIGRWKKKNICYRVAESLAELLPIIT